MMRHLLIAACGISFFWAGQAAAAEWWLVTLGTDRGVFGDKLSLKEVHLPGRRIVAVWETGMFKQVNQGAKSYKSLEYADCGSREIATKSYALYAEDYSVTKSNTIADNNLAWGPVIPDSNGENTVLFACNAARIKRGQYELAVEGRKFISIGAMSLEEAEKNSMH